MSLVRHHRISHKFPLTEENVAQEDRSQQTGGVGGQASVVFDDVTETISIFTREQLDELDRS